MMRRAAALSFLAFLFAPGLAFAAFISFGLTSGGGGGGGSFTAAWQDFKYGGAGQVTDIRAYPDGTEVITTDTQSFWEKTAALPSSWSLPINAVSLPSAMTSNLNANARLMDCAAGGCVAGYGIGLCAYDDNQANTLVGSTDIAYAVYNALVLKSTNFTNANLTWTNTTQAIVGANGNDHGDHQVDQKPYVACDPSSTSGNVAYFSVPSAAPLVTCNGGTTFSTVSGIASPTAFRGEIIAIDPSSSVVSNVTQTIYISNYGTGVYRSTNGGTCSSGSFSLLSGSPTGLVYMTVDRYGVLWGASYTTAYEFSGGSWTTISGTTCCGGGGYGPFSTAVLPGSTSSANEVLGFLSSNNFVGSWLNQSSNGGSTWTASGHNTTFSATDVPWMNSAQQGQNNGTAQISLNSFNGMYDINGDFLLTGGIGVWEIPATASPSVNQISVTAGLENGVENVLRTQPGNPPVDGIYDRGVARHDNADLYIASQYTTAVILNSGVGLDCLLDGACVAELNYPFSSGSWGEHSGYSSDGGHTWTAFAVQPNPSITNGNGMISGTSLSDIIDVPQAGGLLRCSTNSGASWANVSLPGSPSTNWETQQFVDRQVLAGDRVLTGVDYVLNTTDHFYSAAGGCGGTWTQRAATVESAIDGFSAWVVAAPWEPKNVFYEAGGVGGAHPYSGSHLWRSTDGTATFSQITGPQEPQTIGFGAPKPGSGIYPAVVYAGWLSNVWGVYVSWDNMSTWTSLGQYANNVVDSLTNCTGDVNVYGRFYCGFRGTNSAYVDTQDACPNVHWKGFYPGDSLTGTVNLTAYSDGLPSVTVQNVNFYVDGTLIGTQTSGSGTPKVYTQSWVSGGISTGAHLLTVATSGNLTNNPNCTVAAFNASVSGATMTVNSGTDPTQGFIVNGGNMPNGGLIVTASLGGHQFTVSPGVGASGGALSIASENMVAAGSIFTIPVTTH